MDEKLVERLRARANQGGYIPDITLMFQAATALTLAQARIRELETALREIAEQKRPVEWWAAFGRDYETDWLGGYDACVVRARQALKEAPDV